MAADSGCSATALNNTSNGSSGTGVTLSGSGSLGREHQRQNHQQLQTQSSKPLQQSAPASDDELQESPVGQCLRFKVPVGEYLDTSM